MSDIREALEWWSYDDGAEWVKSAPEAVVGHVSVAMDAARRFLALTETGPDYEAAKQAYDDAPVPIRAEDFVRRIVDAALADYLTEEE